MREEVTDGTMQDVLPDGTERVPLQRENTQARTSRARCDAGDVVTRGVASKRAPPRAKTEAR